MSLPPLPPEPDWAAPPRPAGAPQSPRAVWAARGAGGVVFVGLALAGFAGIPDVNRYALVPWLTLAVAAGAAALLVRAARRSGMPAGEVAVGVLLGFVLAAVASLVIGFGACLLLLAGLK